MEMPPQSSIKISCHCCCVRLFMLLARNFSSNKSINNAVESSFQSLGFAWSWRRCVRHNGQMKSLNPSSSGSRNLALEKGPWWERQKKMWFKEKIEKHSACIVCSEKDRRKCDSKKNNEKHSACIMCSEKMAMERRQVSTLEHEAERWNS